MISSTSTVLNSLIDAADLLEGDLSSDQAWLKSVEMMKANGYGALNIMEVDTKLGQALWFRSSMKSQWLSDYIEQDFVALDPLIISACYGQNKIRMTEGKVLGMTDNSGQMQSFTNQIVSWGYGMLDTQVFKVAGEANIKGVTVSRADAGHEPDEQHRLVCAVISAAVGAPLSPNSPGATILPPNLLTIREIDALSFLASGLRNDAIAWKMNIAEITVRMHLASARRKLGAATREEAVALAIRSGQLPL